MKATATYEGQNGVPYVMAKGYIPADKIHEATSIAMEYAVDDWGIAAMAQKMGKTADYETFSKRAHYYKELFRFFYPFHPSETGRRFMAYSVRSGTFYSRSRRFL